MYFFLYSFLSFYSPFIPLQPLLYCVVYPLEDAKRLFNKKSTFKKIFFYLTNTDTLVILVRSRNPFKSLLSRLLVHSFYV